MKRERKNRPQSSNDHEQRNFIRTSVAMRTNKHINLPNEITNIIIESGQSPPRHYDYKTQTTEGPGSS